MDVDETAAGPRAQRQPRVRTADRSYLVLSAVLGFGQLIHQLNQNWSKDVFVHIAAIREFSIHGLDAKNPFIATAAPDAYLTPFHLIAGTIERVTGWDIATVLAVIALFNFVLFVTALRSFVLLVYARPWAPLFALVFTLVAWGLGPWRWSGYLNLASLGFGLPYSATFAIGVGLLTIVAIVRYLRGGPGWYSLAAIVGGATALLCHPLSTLWMGALAVAFVVSEAAAGAPRPRVVAVMLAGMAAVLLSLTWPYFSLLDVASQSRDFDVFHAALDQLIWRRAFLALPGLLGLWLRLRTKRSDPLVLAALFIGAIYLARIPLDRGTLSRMFPGLMLVLHVAFADVAAELVDGGLRISDRSRRIGLAATAGVIAIGLAGSYPGLLREVPRHMLPGGLVDEPRFASVIAPWRPLGEAMQDDSVVAAPVRLGPEVAAFGGHVLVPPDNDPSLRPKGLPARRRALAAILADPSSPTAEKARKRYRVTHILVPRDVKPPPNAGRVVLTTPVYELFALG